MPQQMSREAVLRALRTIRFSNIKGRPVSISWLARMAGYQRQSLHRAAMRGWLTREMSSRLAKVLTQSVSLSGDQITPKSSLGALGGGRDPRGGPRPKR
jgi:hypothetical protein